MDGRPMASTPFITTAVLTLEQLFSGSYKFHLPWVQRAYAWNEQHVGRLVDDVHRASQKEPKRYSLGHIFLAKPGAAPEASLIDGHQRSMTLTMLFALLRDLLSQGALADRLHALIEGGGGIGYHLTPQPSIAPFFQSFVQRPARALAEPDGDIMDLTESERIILANRDHMCGKIERLMPSLAEREAFATFLLERCYVIIEIVEDEKEAWELQSIEQDTALSQHASELYKLSLVMEMPRAEQEVAGRIYEQAQAIVGADDMSKLLGYIRTLKMRRRRSKPVETDLKAHFQLNRTGLAFLEQELLPRAEAFMLLKRRAIGTGEARLAIARALDTLFWIEERQLWMPPALHWLKVKGGDDAETPEFFADLERLTYMLKIGGIDPTDQERHFLRVLNDIDSGNPVPAMPQLAIGPGLLADALDNLRSATFYSKRFHGLVLRRVSWNLAPERDPGPVDGHKVTVEHVLPRKPPRDRRWWQDFKTEAAITAHCNRIGNLAFLSNDDNRRADTLDYVVKRDILRRCGSRLALAEHAAAEEVWTADVILARSEAMIRILLAPWRLAP